MTSPQATTWARARATTRPALLTYPNTVRLPEMTTGDNTAAGRRAIDETRRRVESYEPQAGKAQVLAHLEAVQKAREARAERAHQPLPAALHAALLRTGCVVLLFPALLGLQPTRRHTAALTLVDATTYLAIWPTLP